MNFSTLLTGIDIIDAQHHKLVDLLDELHNAMSMGRGSTVLGHILDELKQYTIYHFITEERAFEKHDYPDRDAHRQSHAKLIGQLDELILKYHRNEIGITIETLDFLNGWVRDHITREDMLYVPHLKDKALD